MKTDKKIEEQYGEVENVKLPHRWKYNEEYMRMENIADVHDENDEFIGTCPIALVPHDIKQFIYDNYTPNTEVQKAVEEAVRGFARWLFGSKTYKANLYLEDKLDVMSEKEMMRAAETYLKENKE